MKEVELRYNAGSGLAEVKHRDGFVKLGRYSTEAEAIDDIRFLFNPVGPIVLRNAGESDNSTDGDAR